MTDTERDLIRQAVEALSGIIHFADGFVVYYDSGPLGQSLREWINEARTVHAALTAALAEEPGDGWHPIETAPLKTIVDLWCLHPGEPATYDSETSAGSLVSNRHKHEVYGWFGNQSPNGVPRAPYDDLIPVAWRLALKPPPLALVQSALTAALEQGDAP
jgi:hypothetical protein